MADKLTVIAQFQAKPGMEDKVKQNLLGMVAPSRRDTGVIDYDIYQSNEDASVFFTYENWTGQDALDAHMQTPHFKALAAESRETLAQPMEVSLLAMISDPAV